MILSQFDDGIPGIGDWFPWNSQFGSQRRFRNSVLRWPSRDPAQQQALNARSIRASEKAADVVHAADVIQQQANRKVQVRVVRRALRGLVRKPLHRYSPARFQSASTRATTSGDIVIGFGQRRVKPSDGNFVVASTPILDP